ncbi:MAG: bacteriohemerythrin [Gammaproteobacteria bacterium]|nr:bacteriohemerythrin [Gammaproteobacteria bacterium]
MQKLWTSDLNIGIDEIDAGNKKIVDYINHLVNAKQQQNMEELENVIEHLLVDYVCAQFVFEEHLMEQAGYEYRTGHEKVHELFAKKLGDLRVRVQAGDPVFDQVIDMLVHWVDSHVRIEDKMYAESVKLKIDQEGGETWVQGVVKMFFG